MPTLLDHIRTTNAQAGASTRARRRHWRAVLIVAGALLTLAALIVQRGS